VTRVDLATQSPIDSIPLPNADAFVNPDGTVARIDPATADDRPRRLLPGDGAPQMVPLRGRTLSVA
jgi:hypothetical protein